nr:flocculation protein FLO11-like [Penaeus vannamei]
MTGQRSHSVTRLLRSKVAQSSHHLPIILTFGNRVKMVRLATLIVFSVLLVTIGSTETAERSESRLKSNVIDLELLLSQLSKPDGPHDLPQDQMLLLQNQLPVKTNESASTPDTATGKRVLRLAVFSDDALLNHLSDLYPEDPLTATEKYITTGVLAIEKLMQQAVDEGVEFKIKLVQVGVWAEKGATPFNTNGLSSSNLLNFCEWASERKPGRGDPGYWHHAMMLTGKELFETTKDSLGVTFVGGLCHPRTSCSVVEANSFKAVQVAAHELAHSMGVPHDGEGAAARCPSEGFIMGQSLSEETFDWSNCSRDAISAFLKNDTCLEREEDGKGYRGLDHTQGGLPGQRYTADEQCALALGTSYRATPSKRSICEYLMCTNGVTTRGTHPALPGTSCGNNRVCVAGQCRAGGGGTRPPSQPSPPSNPDRPPTWPPSNPPTWPPSNPDKPTWPPSNPDKPTWPPSNPDKPTCNLPPNNPYKPPNNPNRPPNRPNRPSRPANKPVPFSGVEETDGNIVKKEKFPLATIPSELANIPMPYRCHFMPPFLHRYIGCGNYPNRNPHSPEAPGRTPGYLDTTAEIYEHSLDDEESKQMQDSPVRGENHGLILSDGAQNLSYGEEAKNSSITEGIPDYVISGELQQSLTFTGVEHSTHASQGQEILTPIQGLQNVSTTMNEIGDNQNSTHQVQPLPSTVQQVQEVIATTYQETPTTTTIQGVTKPPITTNSITKSPVIAYQGSDYDVTTHATNMFQMSAEQMAPTVNVEVVHPLTTENVTSAATPALGMGYSLTYNVTAEQVSTAEPATMEHQQAITQSTSVEEGTTTEPVTEPSPTKLPEQMSIEKSDTPQSTTEQPVVELTTDQRVEKLTSAYQIATEQPAFEQNTEEPDTKLITTEPPIKQVIAEQILTEQLGTEQTIIEQPHTENITAEEITTEHPAAETTTGEQITIKEVTIEQPTTEQSSEEITTEKSTNEQSTTPEPSTTKQNPAGEPPSVPMTATHAVSEQTFTKPVQNPEEDQSAKDNSEEDQSNTIFSVEDFNVTGSGLHFSIPSHLLHSFLGPVLMGSLAKDAPTPKGRLKDKHLFKESFGHQRNAFARIANLREGHHQAPVVAATAPTNTRAIRISPCSRTCGGGTRSVAQVCVKMDSPEVEVSEELCDGLPYSFSPFNQSCNTFPCSVPKWVVGPWSACSDWCGLGIQRRFVACGLPLVAGTSPLAAGRFLTPARCAGAHPTEVRLCKGPCVEVDCTVPGNALHPACRHLLKDTPLEKDHARQSSLR